jgi:hypothetical protein
MLNASGEALFGQEQQGERQRMSEVNSRQEALVREILARDVPAARATTEALGAEAGPVLAKLASHQKSEIRLIVLELAPLAVSTASSKAVIFLVKDSNSTVRAVATGELAICVQKDVVPDLVKLLEEKPQEELTVALINQIGVAGSRENIKDLQPFRSAKSSDVAHQAAAAMAKLGDANELKGILKKLESSDANERVEGLRDCQYIGDQKLVKYFAGALDDGRDFMLITPPHMTPAVMGRICDITVQTMAYMGIRFSFNAEFLARYTREQLDEARKMVAAMNEVAR